jgi:ribosomal protein S20
MQEYNEKWQHRVDELEKQLKEVYEKIRHDRASAKDELIHQNNAYRALKQKLVTANQKNELLNALVDQQRKSAEVNSEGYK